MWAHVLVPKMGVPVYNNPLFWQVFGCRNVQNVTTTVTVLGNKNPAAMPLSVFHQEFIRAVSYQ